MILLQRGGGCLVGVFGSWLRSWLLGQLANAARQRLGEDLFGSEQDRALFAAGDAAMARTARELRPEGSDQEVEHLAAVLEQVFQAGMPTAPCEDQPTILDALQTGVAGQLAVLGDASMTGTGQSSAQALGLSVEVVTETLVRNVVQEILARGAGGGPLVPLADQLNHDLTHLQGQHTAGMLTRLVEELVRLKQPPATPAPPVSRELPRPIADFTGRSDEVATLRALLAVGAGDSDTLLGKATPSVVISAIDGMGGIGKSALAIQVGHELTDAGAFPDGQLYVNLQGATPGLAALHPLDALGRMLRSLGMEPAEIPTDPEEAATRFRSLAADRRLLVLLDKGEASGRRFAGRVAPERMILLGRSRPAMGRSRVPAPRLPALHAASSRLQPVSGRLPAGVAGACRSANLARSRKKAVPALGFRLLRPVAS